MAKTLNKTHKSKPKSSFFFCCLGSFSHETSMESNHNPEQKIRWFSWRRIRKKRVPLDASLSDHKRSLDQVHSSKWRWKSKSKSNPQEPSLIKSQTPATNLALPCQTQPVIHVTPNQTPPRTRHRQRPQQNHASNNLENRNRSHHVASSEEDTSTSAMSYSVSMPDSKRQVRRLSSLSMQPQTTLNQPVRWENAKRYDAAFGMSAVLVTLVIMIVWGRLCAIFCTSAWLYIFPRFRMTNENEIEKFNTDSKDLDLDSKVYKKKVILEGLLERNHRGTL